MSMRQPGFTKKNVASTDKESLNVLEPVIIQHIDQNKLDILKNYVANIDSSTTDVDSSDAEDVDEGKDTELTEYEDEGMIVAESPKRWAIRPFSFAEGSDTDSNDVPSDQDTEDGNTYRVTFGFSIHSDSENTSSDVEIENDAPLHFVKVKKKSLSTHLIDHNYCLNSRILQGNEGNVTKREIIPQYLLNMGGVISKKGRRASVVSRAQRMRKPKRRTRGNITGDKISATYPLPVTKIGRRKSGRIEKRAAMQNVKSASFEEDYSPNRPFKEYYNSTKRRRRKMESSLEERKRKAKQRSGGRFSDSPRNNQKLCYRNSLEQERRKQLWTLKHGLRLAISTDLAEKTALDTILKEATHCIRNLEAEEKILEETKMNVLKRTSSLKKKLERLEKLHLKRRTLD